MKKRVIGIVCVLMLLASVSTSQVNAIGEPYVRGFKTSSYLNWSGDWDGVHKVFNATFTGDTNTSAWFALFLFYGSLGKAHAVSNTTDFTYYISEYRNLFCLPNLSEKQYNETLVSYLEFGVRFTVLNETHIGGAVTAWIDETVWQVNVTMTFKSTVYIEIILDGLSNSGYEPFIVFASIMLLVVAVTVIFRKNRYANMEMMTHGQRSHK